MCIFQIFNLQSYATQLYQTLLYILCESLNIIFSLQVISSTNCEYTSHLKFYHTSVPSVKMNMVNRQLKLKAKYDVAKSCKIHGPFNGVTEDTNLFTV
jgi:hypothetical protein